MHVHAHDIMVGYQWLSILIVHLWRKMKTASHCLKIYLQDYISLNAFWNVVQAIFVALLFTYKVQNLFNHASTRRLVHDLIRWNWLIPSIYQAPSVSRSYPQESDGLCVVDVWITTFTMFFLPFVSIDISAYRFLRLQLLWFWKTDINDDRYFLSFLQASLTCSTIISFDMRTATQQRMVCSRLKIDLL